VTTPAGWTLVANVLSTGSTSPAAIMYIKQAAGGESGTLSVTVPSATGQARMYKVSGVDLTTPQDVTASTVSLAATTAYNIPGVTTVTDGALLFGFCATNGAGSGTMTEPTVLGTWTEDTDVNTTLHTADAHFIWSSHGATGTINFVRSGSVKGAGILAVLRPAAAAATTLPELVMAPYRN
jgi:hypothetical protein